MRETQVTSEPELTAIAGFREITTIEKLTGLAVTTDDDAYLTSQMAVLVLRLSGRLPLVTLPVTRSAARATG